MKLKENTRRSLEATKDLLVTTKNNILYGNVETDSKVMKKFLAFSLPVIAMGSASIAFAATDITPILKFVFQGLGIFAIASGGIGIIVEAIMLFMAKSEEDDQKESKTKSRMKNFAALAAVGVSFFAAAGPMASAVNTLLNSQTMG